MTEEEDERGYRWETEYERTWETIEEDESGALQPHVEQALLARKRQMQRAAQAARDAGAHLRLGMMRHMYVVLDVSAAMVISDLRPSRLQCATHYLERFVEQFLDFNPIGQIGLITTARKRADKVVELTGNARRLVQALRHVVSSMGKMLDSAGEPSVQNALQLALNTLSHMPAHASREILFVLGSLTSCDPGDVMQCVAQAAAANVRCNVVGLAAEVRLHKFMATSTRATFGVALDEEHLADLFNAHLAPATAAPGAESSLIRMGFPHPLEDASYVPRCSCHMRPAPGAHTCPQCRAAYCDLPADCRLCGLTLVSAPHLARSYHHLFPLPAFTEKVSHNNVACHACAVSVVAGQPILVCQRCRAQYCLDCDVFLHANLHSCLNCPVDLIHAPPD